MIALRRAKERHHDLRRKREVWHTFYPQDGADALAGALESERHRVVVGRAKAEVLEVDER